jgi:hypothetical protein
MAAALQIQFPLRATAGLCSSGAVQRKKSRCINSLLVWLTA